MKLGIHVDYFETVGMASKSYTKLLLPVCRKWDLTRNEIDVLLFLYNNPQYDRAADIVAHRGIAKSHVSMSVTNLESRDYLQRRFDPTDRRTAHLILTEQGLLVAREAREVQCRFFATLYAGVTEEEFAQWRGITQKVWENIKNLDRSLD